MCDIHLPVTGSYQRRVKTSLSGVIGEQSEVMGSAWHVAVVQRQSMAPEEII